MSYTSSLEGATPRAIAEHLKILPKEVSTLRGALAVAVPAASQVRRRGAAKIKKEIQDEAEEEVSSQA